MTTTKPPRLSESAVEAVHWLHLFHGGVFEDNFLDISRIDAGVWESARSELEAAALLTVEWEVLLAGRPYLRRSDANASTSTAPTAVRARYVEAYRASMMAIRQAFHGASPKQGMQLMAREESNFRQAVGWAHDSGDHAKASEMADVFTWYLERAGRSDDRDRWMAWLATKGPHQPTAASVEQAAAPAAAASKPATPPQELPAAPPEEIAMPAVQETEGTRRQHAGTAALAKGQIAHAAELYQRALRWFQDAQDTAGIADTCQHFGHLEEAAGRPEEARIWYARAAAKRGR